MMLSRPLSLVWPALLACSASDVLDRRLIYSYDNSDGQVPWSRFADVFPYLVSIQYNGNHQCGGTLIRHNWVLSAAHCFYTASTQVSKFQVWSLANATENSWNKASVDLIVVHPEYHQVTLDHDVALIRLSTSDPNASLVTLESSSARHDGKDATIAGWGSLDAACTRYEFILKEGPTQIVGSNPCVASNQFFNGTERICNEHINASGTDLSGAGCGDSGGPLFVSDGTSGMIQVGLVSYTYQGRDIFARVFTYLGWINGILASPPSSHMLVPPLCQGSCCDDPEYNDPYGQECGSYASKDCDASSTGFTDAETADLTSKCRSSCKQCPVCEATDSSCCDRVGFQSQSGKACDQFQGLDCSSDPESAEVLQNCPFTCGTCTSGTDCSDSAYFKDVKSHTCPQWKNYDCSRAVEDFSYTQADRDLVLHMCPLSCGTCTKRGHSHGCAMLLM